MKCMDKKLDEYYARILCYFEKILEAAPYKTEAVRFFTFHLINHPSQTKKTSWAELEM